MSKELFSKEKIKNLINEVDKSIEIVNINKFSNDGSFLDGFLALHLFRHLALFFYM